MSLLRYLSGAFVLIYAVSCLRFCPTFISKPRMMVLVDSLSVLDAE